MMMAPAPIMVMTTSQQPGKTEWAQPSFHQLENQCPCYCQPGWCCSSVKKYEVQTIQGLQCQFPGCNQPSVTTCSGHVRFCTMWNGPITHSGCGRALCQVHAKYQSQGLMAGDQISCDTEECYGEAKSSMMKMHCLIPMCLSCIAPCLCMCGKSCIGGSRRYRGPQNQEMKEDR